MNIRDMVFENLNHAAQNGHFEDGEQLHGMTADEIVYDMKCYCVECEDIEPELLLPHVQEWLNIKEAMGRLGL